MRKPSELLTEFGSDKCTEHSYGDFYDSLFLWRRFSCLLEIGVESGASMRAWMTLDNEMHVIGVDKDKKPGFNVVQAYTPDYIPVMNHLALFSKSPDIIIDDGSHKEWDQVLGWYYLSPFLLEGGIYIIEDITDNDVVCRLRQSGWTIEDFRPTKGRWDDVIAWRTK
jgi:hypothetical protein